MEARVPDDTVTDEEMMKTMSRHRSPSDKKSPRSNEVTPRPVYSTLNSTPISAPISGQIAQTTPPRAIPNNGNKARACNFWDKCRRSSTSCGYAHTLEEFQPVECKFATCRKQDCRFFHPAKESKGAFLERFRNAVSRP